MKTIIQVVQHLTPGGIEVMALEILRLKAKETHMIIVSLEGKKEDMLGKWSRLKRFEDNLIFLNKKPGYSLITLTKLLYIFTKHQPIAVLSHHIGPLFYAGLCARLSFVKNIIHTEHDAWHLEDQDRRKLEHKLLRLVRPTFVADSKTVQCSFEKYIPNIKSQVISNGIDTEYFSPGDRKTARKELKLPEHDYIIGSAGRLEKVKGHHILIKSLIHLPENYCVAIAGSGSQLQHLKQLAVEHKVSHRVYFLGHQESMQRFYQSLNVFCLPSFNEGMPLAPLEAQACNVPCILSNVGGCVEAMCPKSGQLIPAGSPSALSEAILQISSIESELAPRDFVVKHANIKTMTHKYIELCLAG